MPDDICALPARELRRSMNSGALSSAEVVDAYISRIEKVNPLVNAITATAFDRARAEATVADRTRVRLGPTGPLHGMPIAVKDNEATEGLLTTYGSAQFRSNIPSDDAPVVARLRKAGAIVLAKTNIPEFANGANTRNSVWGATGNPFDPRLIAGGSSGGSAAALALDLVPLATGSDTGGSIRIPAALCGVVGFRPAPGTVPIDRKQFLWSPLSVIGPMARDVDDLYLHLLAMAGYCDADPLSFLAEFPDVPLERVDLRTVKVAFTPDFGSFPVDRQVRAAFAERVEFIADLVLGCDEVSFDARRAVAAFEVMRSEIYLAQENRGAHINLTGHSAASGDLGATMTLRDGVRAQMDQADWYRQMRLVLRRHDVIVTPVVPVPPFDWHEWYPSAIDGVPMTKNYEWLTMCAAVSLSGHPAISIPCGLDASGMPFGLQLIGSKRGEIRLLQIAAALQDAFESGTEFARPIPDLEHLASFDVDLLSVVTGSADGVEATSQGTMKKETSA